MRANIREKRLENDFRALREFLSNRSHIQLDEIEGDPPDYCQLLFETCGIVKLDNNRPVYGFSHRIELVFPADYPRDGPIINHLTPVFHPNFYPDGNVCVSTWIPGRTVMTLVQQIDDMIAYRNFDKHFIRNAPNPEAAQWVEENWGLIPITDSACE